MKTRNLLLSLCCMAALTACTSNDEPTIAESAQARKLEFTLSIDNGAATRADFTSNTDGSLSSTWAEGDAVALLWYDSEEGKYMAEKFTLNADDIGKTTGSFSGTTVAQSGQKLAIVYPYSAVICDEYDEIKVTILKQTGKLEDLSKYTIMCAQNVELTADGQIPEGTKLANNKVTILRLPKGLKLFDSSKSITSLKYSLVGTSSGAFKYSNGGIFTLSDDDIELTAVTVDANGCLSEDYYIAFYPSSSGYLLAGFVVTVDEIKYTFVSTKADWYAPQVGRVYTLKEVKIAEE